MSAKKNDKKPSLGAKIDRAYHELLRHMTFMQSGSGMKHRVVSAALIAFAELPVSEQRSRANDVLSIENEDRADEVVQQLIERMNYDKRIAASKAGGVKDTPVKRRGRDAET